MPKKVIVGKWPKFIRDNRLKMPSRKLAEHIGCSKTAVQNYIRKNGLQAPDELVKKWRSEAKKGTTIFTREQDELLKQNYLKVAEKPLARILGVSSPCLQTRKKQLGLVVPAKIIEDRKNIGRFKKGCQAHNKGKKQTEFMSPEAIERAKISRFKKGNRPHNQYDENGIISIRKDTKTGIDYKYIRISPGNWRALSRVNWEAENGPIPKGFIIIFKDRDSLNCEPDNLECISKSENGLRTINMVHSRPPELKKAIRLTNRIKSKIKSKIKHDE